MATRQITCINKGIRNSPTERISHVGGSFGKITTEMAIHDINMKINDYFVMTPSGTANVKIAWHEQRPYLRTESDNTTVDNLLSLPECS